jgi:RNA polymerase sigma factor for flagellar operon FliA
MPTHSERGRNEITAALWRDYVARRDPATRAMLLEQYLGLVHHAAREIVPRAPAQLDLEDLISAGTVGLVQALEGFDPARGLAFSSFAVPRIRGAIIDELRSWDWVPRSVRDWTRQIEETHTREARRLGREPTETEMAEAIGVNAITYRRHASRSARPVLVALDAASTRGPAEPPTLAEMIPDPSTPDPLQTIVESETLGKLLEAFRSLSQRDQLVLQLSFYEKLTLREISEILHITQSRVCQIRTRALSRLVERTRMAEAA